jgi:hypothetical protein
MSGSCRRRPVPARHCRTIRSSGGLVNAGRPMDRSHKADAASGSRGHAGFTRSFAPRQRLKTQPLLPGANLLDETSPSYTRTGLVRRPIFVHMWEEKPI